MQDLAVDDAVAELPGVCVVADLEDPSRDVASPLGEEALHVVAVHGQTPVVAELPAHRGKPAQASEIDHAGRRSVQLPQDTRAQPPVQASGEEATREPFGGSTAHRTSTDPAGR